MDNNTTTLPVTLLSAKEVAARLRKQLKAAFPGEKFTVRKDGGDVCVTWEGGPGQREVEGITLAYEFTRWHPEQDYYAPMAPRVLDGELIMFTGRIWHSHYR